MYQIVHGTKGHMTVYGTGCHPQNIIWTGAKLVTHKILYGPERSWGPYTILWVTDQSIWPEVPWTIFYIILNTCKSVRWHVFVIVYLRHKKSSDKIWKKTLYWSAPVHILKYWPAALTKTNMENKNVKYNISVYTILEQEKRL